MIYYSVMKMRTLSAAVVLAVFAGLGLAQPTITSVLDPYTGGTKLAPGGQAVITGTNLGLSPLTTVGGVNAFNLIPPQNGTTMTIQIPWNAAVGATVPVVVTTGLGASRAVQYYVGAVRAGVDLRHQRSADLAKTRERRRHHDRDSRRAGRDRHFLCDRVRPHESIGEHGWAGRQCDHDHHHHSHRDLRLELPCERRRLASCERAGFLRRQWTFRSGGKWASFDRRIPGEHHGAVGNGGRQLSRDDFHWRRYQQQSSTWRLDRRQPVRSSRRSWGKLGKRPCVLGISQFSAVSTSARIRR